MKCDHCGSFDSMANYMYVDKNHLLLTDTELKALGIVNLQTNNPCFRKVILCGICYETIDSKKNRMIKIKNADLSFDKENSKKRQKMTFYICPYCQKENEPLRNTCRKCERDLFSADFETKSISSDNYLYSRQNLISRIRKLLTNYL